MLLAVATLAALAVWEGGHPQQTPAAHWSVALTIVAAVAVAVAAGRGRQHTPSRRWLASSARAAAGWRRAPQRAAGAAVWVLLVLAVIGWDMNSFVHQAHDLPTLSYLFGRVTRFRWGRALVFAAWLAAGAGLVAGCLVPRGRNGAGR